MSVVRSHLLPLHGAMSMRSLAPAAATNVWFASMATVGSFCEFWMYGVDGLPTLTSASPPSATAGAIDVIAAATVTTASALYSRRVCTPSRVDPRGGK